MILDDYQIDAVNRLQSGKILYGGVGSGKSRTALAYYYTKECGGLLDGEDYGFDTDYIPMSDPKDLYIITTAKKRDSSEWTYEMAPLLLSPDPKVSLYGDDVKVVIDSWNNIKKYVDVSGAFFIFDEQRVVGYGSWTKSFLKITKKNHWILLTATPGDNWMDYIPVFIANGFYKNKTEFLEHHAVYNRYSKYPKVDRFVEQGRLIRLRNNILVPMEVERHTVRHMETVMVSYDKEKFRKVLKDRWDIYEDKPIKNASKLYSLIRKVVNSDPSRLEAVQRLCESHAKLIIFYNFDYELYALKELKYPEGTVIAEWTGHKHENIPKTNRWVYLVQYAAGAEGWNCVETDSIIFFSQSYSYKLTAQAAGRIDRMNTPFKDLYYYCFRSNSWIDVAIYRCLKAKKNFNESDYDVMNS